MLTHIEKLIGDPSSIRGDLVLSKYKTGSMQYIATYIIITCIIISIDKALGVRAFIAA